MKLEIYIDGKEQFYKKHDVDVINCHEIIIDEKHFSLLPEENRKKRILKYIELLENGRNINLYKIYSFAKFDFGSSINNKIAALLIQEVMDDGSSLISKTGIISISIYDDKLYINNKEYSLDLNLIKNTAWCDLSIDLLLPEKE